MIKSIPYFLPPLPRPIYHTYFYGRPGGGIGNQEGHEYPKITNLVDFLCLYYGHAKFYGFDLNMEDYQTYVAKSKLST